MVETRGGRRFAVTFFVAAFLVLLLGRWVKPVNDAALTAAAPFAAVASAVSETVGDTVSGVFQGPGLRSQNQTLRKEVGILLRRNLVLQQQAYENRIFRRMLRYDNLNDHLDLVAARVIGHDPNSLAPEILIDKGTRDGLRKGMTVVDPDGYFVGSISDITADASKVLLMLSPSSSVGALDIRTRASGLVEGQFAGGPQLRFVLASATLHPGDLIVTSGQMNLYPPTILIGQIGAVHSSSNGLFQTADIHPAADLGNLEIVQVVRNFNPAVPNRIVTRP